MTTNPNRPLPVWRSILFVPVNVRKYVDKAVTTDADAICLDLEDSVAPDDKAAARDLVVGAAAHCAARGADILVRINRPLELAVRDIEAVVSSRVAALMLPKLESPGHVRLLAELVESVERAKGIPVGRTTFYAVVETVQAFSQMFEIAAAHPRIVAFTCGTEDFTATCGSQPDPDVLLYPKQQGILAARAAGVVPLGVLSSSADFHDLDGYCASVATSRRFGIEGSACIHPAQVPILNDGFAPGEAEVRDAERMVEAYRQAYRDGRGSVAFDGRMIDVPVVARAERVLARAGCIASRQESRRDA